MFYPFITLDDETVITHSQMHDDGSVDVYLEKPDPVDCFHHATCVLPTYEWKDVVGFSEDEMKRFAEVVSSTAHLILEFATTGGFQNASGF